MYILDGVRRSTRKRRKNKVLSEYETGAIEGMDDTDLADDGATDPEAQPDGATPCGESGGVKKGMRGRPPKSSLSTPAASPASVAANLSAPMQQMLMKMGLLPSMYNQVLSEMIKVRKGHQKCLYLTSNTVRN